MAEDVFNTLKWKLHPIFENYEFVKSLCNHLYNYMIDIPKLIVPKNSKLASTEENGIPITMTPEYIEGWEIDEQTAIEHKAACVWTLLGKNYSKEQLEQYCSLYGITTEQALNWKDYWLNQ